MKNKKYFIVVGGLFILLSLTLVYASRLPTIQGDEDNWGTILNNYLSRIAGANATQLNMTMVNGTNIYANAINSTHLGGGNYTFDSGTLFVDSSNNRVGIGTTSPETFLDVRGLTYMIRDGGGSILALRPSNSSWANSAIFKINSSSPQLLIQLRNSTGTGWVDSMSFDKYGRIGIGTTSPSASLEIIRNSTDSTPTVSIVQQSAWMPNHPYALNVTGYTNLGGLRINIADAENGMYGGANQMGFSVADGYRISFGNFPTYGEAINIINGKMGIGTTSPTAKLHILETTVGEEAFIIDRGHGGKNLTFITPGGSPAQLSVKASDEYSMGFFVEDGGDYTKGDIKFFQDIFVNGNVGIGTNSPGSKLEVNGNVNITGNITTVDCIHFESGGMICDSS